MNELQIIKMSFGENEANSVDARTLHNEIGSKQDFSTWVKVKVIDNPFFMENQDYILLHNVVEQKGSGGHNRKDYALTIDTAKKVAMAEQTEIGNKVRDYFLECEKVATEQYKIPKTKADALRLAADLEEELQEKNELLQIQAPKVEFAEKVSSSSKLISVGDYARFISAREGFVIGRNNLYKFFRVDGLIDRKNIPYQRYIDSGWFKVVETTYENPGTNGPMFRSDTKITGVGQISLLARITKSKHFKEFAIIKKQKTIPAAKQ